MAPGRGDVDSAMIEDGRAGGNGDRQAAPSHSSAYDAQFWQSKARLGTTTTLFALSPQATDANAPSRGFDEEDLVLSAEKNPYPPLCFLEAMEPLLSFPMDDSSSSMGAQVACCRRMWVDIVIEPRPVRLRRGLCPQDDERPLMLPPLFSTSMPTSPSTRPSRTWSPTCSEAGTVGKEITPGGGRNPRNGRERRSGGTFIIEAMILSDPRPPC